jgi:hypothetical protein
VFAAVVADVEPELQPASAIASTPLATIVTR